MCCKELISLLEAEDKNECFSNSTVAKEHNKEFRIKRSKKQSVCKVQIDDCLMTSEATKKCDYFFRICETGENLLVELKGTDVTRAVNQIVETFKMLNSKLKQPPQDYCGYIVSRAVPKAELQFRKAKEKAFKDHGVLIKKESQKLTIRR